MELSHQARPLGPAKADLPLTAKGISLAPILTEMVSGRLRTRTPHQRSSGKCEGQRKFLAGIRRRWAEEKAHSISK